SPPRASPSPVSSRAGSLVVRSAITVAHHHARALPSSRSKQLSRAANDFFRHSSAKPSPPRAYPRPLPACLPCRTKDPTTLLSSAPPFATRSRSTEPFAHG